MLLFPLSDVRTLNLYSLSTWDSLATQSIACGGLKIRQPATIYCHCQVNLLLQHTTMHNTVSVFQIIYFAWFSTFLLLKSRFSEKATKFEKISHLFCFYLVRTTVLSKEVRYFFKFCGLLIMSQLYKWLASVQKLMDL